jgi:hypothetical protein
VPDKRPSVKNEKQYEALKDKRRSKETSGSSTIDTRRFT